MSRYFVVEVGLCPILLIIFLSSRLHRVHLRSETQADGVHEEYVKHRPDHMKQAQ